MMSLSMSLDYLQDLEQKVDRGATIFACQGQYSNQWHLSEQHEEIRQKAQRTSDLRKIEINVYRIVNRMETMSTDSYLVVRKILEPGPRGEPHLQWSIVDTKEAAETVRDVTLGPTPYFGVTLYETVTPKR